MSILRSLSARQAAACEAVDEIELAMLPPGDPHHVPAARFRQASFDVDVYGTELRT